MSNISALNTALSGIQRGMADMQYQASQVARSQHMESQSAKDFADPMVKIKMSEAQVAASARLVRAVDESVGTLLDIIA